MDRALSTEQRDAASRALTAELAAAGLRDAEDVALEAVAVLDALVAADRAVTSQVDARESLSLGALLGRRLASGRVSVTAALATVEALGRARHAASGRTDGMAELRAVVLEGYAAGVHEAAHAAIEERHAARAQIVALSSEVVLCPLPALEDADRMSAAVDGLGRALLARDPKACVVLLTGGLAQREAAAAEGLAAIVEHARMIGAAVVVVVTDAIARDALRARIDGDVPFAEDVGGALAVLGHAVQKQRSGLARWLPR